MRRQATTSRCCKRPVINPFGGVYALMPLLHTPDAEWRLTLKDLCGRCPRASRITPVSPVAPTGGMIARRRPYSVW